MKARQIEDQAEKEDSKIELNRIKINEIAIKTPKVMTNVSMKRRGVVYSNKILAIPDTGAVQ